MDFSDEQLEEWVYEDNDIDVDKLIANLKSNVSDYIYDDLEAMSRYFDDEKVSDEFIEKNEPSDKTITESVEFREF